MKTIQLIQKETDNLIKTPKIKIDTNQYNLPDLGKRIEIPLISENKREYFSLDLSTEQIEHSRKKFQLRARTSIVLARIDYGAPHRNPSRCSTSTYL